MKNSPDKLSTVQSRIKSLIDSSRHALMRCHELKLLLETNPADDVRNNIVAAIKISLAHVGGFNDQIRKCYKQLRGLNHTKF